MDDEAYPGQARSDEDGIFIRADLAERLWHWLESEDAPPHWEYPRHDSLGHLQSVLSCWRKYDGPI